ncbi:MAG: GGDEF domain-containing protein [Candidatus Saccharimonadales bacterium]
MTEREDFLEEAIAAAERAVELGVITEKTLSIEALRAVVEQARLAKRLRHENASLREENERDLLTHALTRAATQRRLDEIVQEMKLAKRKNDPEAVVVIYIDLYKLKEVNDTFGHEMGDSKLWHFAANTLIALREEDVFGRLHGDEFLIVLPITRGTEAERVAAEVTNKIDENIGWHNQHLGEEEPELRITKGVAIFLRGTELSGDEMIRQADSAMYEEKGRQRREDGQNNS